MRRLAQVLREFNTMDLTIEKLAPKSGDVLLFKVGDSAKLQGPMLEAFLQHLHERGIHDCMAMVIGPEDEVELVLKQRLYELATAAGFVAKEETDQATARVARQKGRHDVLRLLEVIGQETINPEHTFQVGDFAMILGRVREAINEAAGNGKGEDHEQRNRHRETENPEHLGTSQV